MVQQYILTNQPAKTTNVIHPTTSNEPVTPIVATYEDKVNAPVHVANISTENNSHNVSNEIENNDHYFRSTDVDTILQHVHELNDISHLPEETITFDNNKDDNVFPHPPILVYVDPLTFVWGVMMIFMIVIMFNH